MRFPHENNAILHIFFHGVPLFGLGLILGVLGAFLGVLLVLVRAFGGTLHAQNLFWDSLPGQIYCLFVVSCYFPADPLY